MQNLRVGANWRSVIGPMARAVAIHREGPRCPKATLDKAAAAATAAYHLCPSLDVLVPALLEGDPTALDRLCAMRPGINVLISSIILLLGMLMLPERLQ